MFSSISLGSFAEIMTGGRKSPTKDTRDASPPLTSKQQKAQEESLANLLQDFPLANKSAIDSPKAKEKDVSSPLSAKQEEIIVAEGGKPLSNSLPDLSLLESKSATDSSTTENVDPSNTEEQELNPADIESADSDESEQISGLSASTIDLMSEELVESPKLEAKTSSDPVYLYPPKMYALINSDEKESDELNPYKVQFFVMGCGGAEGVGQKLVAELMNEKADKNTKIILNLGDTFYFSGVDSRKDPAFKAQHDAIYRRSSLTNLKKIPEFCLPGNHDYDIQRKASHLWRTVYSEINFAKIQYQIEHTFIDSSGEVDPAILKQYKEDQLDLSKIPLWNMPSRYGAEKLIEGVVLYRLDTNTIVRDYLASLDEDQHNSFNQIIWLQDQVKKDNASIRLLSGHHSRVTIGKRAFHSDDGLYLSPEDLEKLEKIGIKKDKLGIKVNYNEIVNQVFERLKIKFDAGFSAHDHNMGFYLDPVKNICQVISGGGGGELQDRCVHRDSVKFFEKEFGFVKVTVDLKATKPENRILFDFFNVKKNHVRFNSVSSEPQINLAKQEPGVEQIRTILVEACQVFLKNKLKAREEEYKAKKATYEKVYGFFAEFLSSYPSDIEEADKLINFLNRYESFSLTELGEYLNKMADPKKPVKELTAQLNEALQKQYSTTYTEFCKMLEQLALLPELEEMSDGSLITSESLSSRLSSFPLS